MSDKTGIEWCDASWNPIRGCSRVSEGCRNCYAERVAARFSGPGQPYEGLVIKGRWNGTVRLVPEHLADPLRWKRPRRIFVNSMSDLFHESLSHEQIAAVFGVMAAAPQHTFQVLTKRPERAVEWFEWYEHDIGGGGPRATALYAAQCLLDSGGDGAVLRRVGRGDGALAWLPWPLPNVWLGVSVENQATADERIPLLLQCPAAVRWVSAEPLVGQVDLDEFLGEPDGNGELIGPRCNPDGSSAVSWVVCGGESGPGARPMHQDWARKLRDQCNEAGVPFLFKQWGEWRPPLDGEDYNTAYGNSGRPPCFLVGPDGHRHCFYPKDCEALRPEESRYWPMLRVGKKAAGRMLDGVTWDQYPEAQP